MEVAVRTYLGPELATGQCVYTADRVALHRKQYECALHTRLECCAI